MEELLGARVASAATQPLRDFAPELRREFLMTGFEVIGCSCEYFPCRQRCMVFARTCAD